MSPQVVPAGGPRLVVPCGELTDCVARELASRVDTWEEWARLPRSSAKLNPYSTLIQDCTLGDCLVALAPAVTIALRDNVNLRRRRTPAIEAIMRKQAPQWREAFEEALQEGAHWVGALRSAATACRAKGSPGFWVGAPSDISARILNEFREDLIGEIVRLPRVDLSSVPATTQPLPLGSVTPGNVAPARAVGQPSRLTADARALRRPVS